MLRTSEDVGQATKEDRQRQGRDHLEDTHFVIFRLQEAEGGVEVEGPKPGCGKIFGEFRENSKCKQNGQNAEG
jgi:hypothetical protein